MNELILVVDDEYKIVQLARDYLEKNGYRVVSAGNGNDALAAARRDRPDLIVLDLMLPGLDGREVCRILRTEMDAPIIMLTALSEESDQLVGLELGADDYITKPFSPRLLVARVRAALRRSQGRLKPPVHLAVGGLEIDLEKHSVHLNGQSLHLTPNEFDLLTTLIRSPGQTFTRQQLVDQLYGGTYSSFDRSIDSHVKNLRRKIETDPESPHYIETVYGIGYRFVDSNR